MTRLKKEAQDLFQDNWNDFKKSHIPSRMSPTAHGISHILMTLWLYNSTGLYLQHPLPPPPKKRNDSVTAATFTGCQVSPRTSTTVSSSLTLFTEVYQALKSQPAMHRSRLEAKSSKSGPATLPLWNDRLGVYYGKHKNHPCDFSE